MFRYRLIGRQIKLHRRAHVLQHRHRYGPPNEAHLATAIQLVSKARYRQIDAHLHPHQYEVEKRSLSKRIGFMGGV
jgi:hypothetical protein